MAKQKSPNTFQLLARLPRQLKQLASAEFGNAKTEVASRVRNLGIALVLVVFALCVLFWVIALLLTAAVAGLSSVFPVWLAALIIAAGGILTIVVAVAIALPLFKRGNPVPTQTIERILSDFDAADGVKDAVSRMQTQPGKSGTKPGKTGVWE